MKKWILGIAAIFAFCALPATGPAQARIANPSLAETPLAGVHQQVEQAQYYRDRRRWRRHHGYRHGYRRNRYRHCWNDRVRVRTPAGYFVWRTHRRCGWRYRSY